MFTRQCPGPSAHPGPADVAARIPRLESSRQHRSHRHSYGIGIDAEIDRVAWVRLLSLRACSNGSNCDGGLPSPYPAPALLTVGDYTARLIAGPRVLTDADQVKGLRSASPASILRPLDWTPELD